MKALAGRAVVTQIVVAYSLSRLEVCRSFTEFVKIFAEFGGEMVDLAHRSGDRQHDLKSDKRRAQMGVARAALERHTMLLLTSSKTLLRHPESESALQCRDGVFDQIRTALQLIAICVSDGVVPVDPARFVQTTSEEPLDIGIQLTANAAIKQLTEMLEMVRMTSRVGVGVRERLIGALDALCEMTQDDSSDQLRSDGIDVTVERLNRRLKDLSKQLQIVAMEHISEVLRANEDQVLLSSIKACAVAGDIDGVERYMEKFREHSEHMQEVCRLLHHISLTDALHVNTGHCERNMRALAPLTLLSGRTLCQHPSSRIARENLEVFCDTWSQSVNDLSRLAKESDSAACGRVAAEKQAYMSLPRPGVSSSDSSSSLPSFRRSHDLVPSQTSSMQRFRNAREVPLRILNRSFESQTVTRLICDSDDSTSSASIDNRENRGDRQGMATTTVVATGGGGPPVAAIMSQGGDELSSAASGTSEDRKAFEYRISLILDDLRSAPLHG
ncbi:unnamed protein product [Nippostrongylus brasiliensis]|uniref:Alpha-catulin (inferred by orthology to a human protein) n=1 Tax=Nippostrongylus brasiliensis TaxID=27835 RepID=A0A0N4XFP5_NIPBR|nr:unnamed protein product [Nippostrongylus brasiliensis]